MTAARTLADLTLEEPRAELVAMVPRHLNPGRKRGAS